VKVQAPAAPGGHFTKDAFKIDLANETVTCPAERLVQIRRREDGSGVASFGIACKSCPLAASCSDSKEGRKITLNKHERLLAETRAHQRSPEWRANYRATRPKVERKLAHLMRRRHGGRRARVRGTQRVGEDFALLSAAAIVAMVRVWHPRRAYAGPAVVAGGAADEPTPEFAERAGRPITDTDDRTDSRADVVKAYAPYAIIIAVFVICQISAVKSLLDKTTVKFQWPGLDIVSAGSA